MVEQRYVFIGYSRKDKQFVDRISEDLRKAGIELWLDVEQISAGTSWQNEILRGLRGATALIYVASMNSVRSMWIEEEVSAFHSQGNTVIPAVLDDVGAEQMPRSLRDIAYADFRKDYNQAIQQLISALADIADPSIAIVRPSSKSKGYIFLSYAEEDNNFVIRLRKFLIKQGYAYWDYSESARDYHTQIFIELEGVIIEAKATLSILSPAWKRSQWTVKEYLFSEEIGTPVFLLRAKDMGPTLVVAGVPYIDFLGRIAEGFRKLNRELRRKGL